MAAFDDYFTTFPMVHKNVAKILSRAKSFEKPIFKFKTFRALNFLAIREFKNKDIQNFCH